MSVADAGSRWSSLLGCALLMGLSACGDASVRAGGARETPVAGPALVGAGHVVVVRRDRTIATVAASGEVVDDLSTLPPQAGEPDAVAVSTDGQVVLVSAVKQDDDVPSVCAATVLQVLADGRTRELAEGAGIALSGSGRRLAYFRYATVDGFCRRTSLIVRDLADGAETTVTTLRDGPVGGTPPEWPVNWSPDEAQIAHVSRTGAVVTQVGTGATAAVDEGDGGRPLAPAWLPDGRLVVLHGCCIGGGSVRATGAAVEVFAVPGPLRSLRAGRDGVGAWFTVEDQGLHHWDGRDARAVLGDALLTSG